MLRQMLVALSLGATVCTLPVSAAQPKQNQNYSTFTEWCENRERISEGARHTVEALLKKVETQNCSAAGENLTNLTSLNLDRNQITDISPLSGLNNLTELSLWHNQITDISPLSGLTNLTELTLWINQITDISPLSRLTNLTFLGLRSNQITDISPLSKRIFGKYRLLR